MNIQRKSLEYVRFENTQLNEVDEEQLEEDLIQSDNDDSMKKCTSAVSQSGSKAKKPIQEDKPCLVTPLDKHYYNLKYRTKVAYWKIFSAKSYIGDKGASIHIFEKKSNVKAPTRIGRVNRLTLLELVKYDVSQLLSLAHPRILHLLHGLEDSKEMTVFATEPIISSLDEFITQNNVSSLEMKLGIMQIIDGLSYLHNNAKILHGNLTPNAIYVTNSRFWKISGFSFSVFAKDSNNYPCFPWTKKLPVELQPDLDFLAPEYLIQNQQVVTVAADIFSLGVLICWIITGGKRLIDAKNNVETYTIICGQLDTALQCIANELGPNLLDAMLKVLSCSIEQRPSSVQLISLIKYFDDVTLSVLRQLDDIAQIFDPANKSFFLSNTLMNNLANIPEDLWFNRILQRFNEFLIDSHEFYAAVARPLFYMLEHCESHNIYKLRSWIHRIISHAQQKNLKTIILENLSILFRRISDEEIEYLLHNYLIDCLRDEDSITQGQAIRSLRLVGEFLPRPYIDCCILPTMDTMTKFLEENASHQVDYLQSLSSLSLSCDSILLQNLITIASRCYMQQHDVIYAKACLVQRILSKDVCRLKNRAVICLHLLGPITTGLALNEFSYTQYEEILDIVKVLIEIVEQLRRAEDSANLNLIAGKLGNRRVSMSNTHLPRVMITSARSSCSDYDTRKMSFLSADGRLEDRGKSELKSGGNSVESDISSNLEDPVLVLRRRSWLGACSTNSSNNYNGSHSSAQALRVQKRLFIGERRSRTRSPSDAPNKTLPNRPNSFTNLGHNLACTLWRTLS